MSKLKKRLLCKKCSYAWEYMGKTIRAICPLCGAETDARDRKEWSKSYALKHPERKVGLKKWLKSHKRSPWSSRLKEGVLRIVSNKLNPVCENCGCNNLKLLEVNHKNGGGRKEHEGGKYAHEFYWKIIKLERKTDDLNVLCRVCNSLHYLELKHGKLPFEVKWTGKKSI